MAAACTESAQMPAADETSSDELTPSQQVQEVLDARAEALADGDVAGYLEPLDQAAREIEEPIAAQAAELPLSEVRLRLPDPTFDQREVDGEEVMVADNTKVDFVFRYEDMPDDNPFHFRLRSDFERHDGEWRVADSELVVPDPRTPVPMPPMWALGPVEVARSAHFLAFHRPGVDDPQRALGVAEEARSQLMPQLTLEAAPAHVLQLAQTTDEYERIINPAGPSRSVAMTSMYTRETGYAQSRIPQNRHMSVNLEAVFAERLPPEAVGGGGGAGHGGMGGGDASGDGEDHQYEPQTTPREVFQHELGHLALSRFTRTSTPVWVAEGGAMELAGEQRTQSWQHGLADGTFADMTFLELSRRDPTMGLDSMEYAYVNAAVSSLVDEFGPERFWEFYRDFKELETGSAGTPLEQIHADGTNRLLFRIYDIGEETLDERALEWMRQATGQE